MEAHIHSVVNTDPRQLVYYAYALQPSTLRALRSAQIVKTRSRPSGTPYRMILRRYPAGYGWQVRALRDFFLWARQHRDDIRVLHAHGSIWCGIWCSIAGRWLGKPVLVSEHSSAFPRKTYPLLARLLARIFLPGVQGLLPVTANLGSHMEAYAPGVPQHVVANCVDTEVFTPTPLPPAGTLKLLYVGAFVEVKRVDLLLRSVALLARQRPLNLNLGGDGPLLPSMRRLAQELQIQNLTHFLGTLSRQQVRAEIAKSHVVVLASAWESQPCVLIEAMLSGRPVVAPNVGGVPELGIDDDCGRLFEPGDQHSLVTALEEVAQSLSTFEPNRIADSCRERFSYAAAGKALTSLYDSLSR